MQRLTVCSLQALVCVGAGLLVPACEGEGATTTPTLSEGRFVQVVQPLQSASVAVRPYREADGAPDPGGEGTGALKGAQSGLAAPMASEPLDETITAEHLEVVLNRLQDQIERGE